VGIKNRISIFTQRWIPPGDQNGLVLANQTTWGVETSS
jgi:hypothetical protein